MSREIGGTANRETGAIPPAEWAVAAVGLVLVIAVVSILSWENLRGRGKPPDIRLSIDQIQTSSSGGFLVQVEVENAGEETASGLKVRGMLDNEQASVQESAEAELDFLPGASKRKVGLYFRSDPRQGHLTLFASGYQEP
jgi:uncharacterized protein (TIGR02588 family)